MVDFKPDPMAAAKKKFPPQPQNHAEVRDSLAELNGFELQKIQAGPTILNFGQMFIKRLHLLIIVRPLRLFGSEMICPILFKFS